MIQGLSKEQILKIDSKTEFFVSKYSYSKTTLRAKCRRMCKDGLLKLVRQDNKCFYYRKNCDDQRTI